MRLKILCLPALYTALCEGFGLDVQLVICRLIPVAVLLASYGAYYSLGRTLFKGDRTASLLFVLVVSVLYWFGDYMMQMDGFLLLHCGYRGGTIRNCVLLPYAWNLCLNKKWLPAALAFLAEACIVWTLYGMGYCVASAVVILALHVGNGRYRSGEDRICRNS